MGKLSKAKALTETEKFCIEGMINNEMSVSEIARTLGREKSLIEKLLEDYEEETTPLTINETASGNKGVAIMTEAGSYRVDEAKKREAKPTKTSETAIHKINE